MWNGARCKIEGIVFFGLVPRVLMWVSFSAGMVQRNGVRVPR